MRIRIRPALLLAAVALLAFALVGGPVPVPAPATAPAAATPATAAFDGGHVWAVQGLPDGTVAYTAYRVAPGVTAAQLYAALRAKGVSGLQVPGPLPPAVDPFRCYSGTAYAYDSGRCPPARWHWNGFADPQVYFRDHTPAGWPVRASVTQWNRAVGVDSFWTGGACPAGGRHCVHVRSGNFGATGWSGNTSYRLDGARYFVDGSVTVQLNDHYAASAADRRNTTCHELGHALGVAFNLSTASCMYSRDIPSNPQLPHASDLALLRTIIYKD